MLFSRSGRGLSESCSDSVRRLARIADEMTRFAREKELKLERRKRYLHVLGEESAALSNDEDLVHFHEYAAESGEPHSQVTLGNLYLIGGHGLNVSYEKAFGYYEDAATSMDPRGLAMLAFMHEKGFGCEVSEIKALELYEKAAELQDGFAYSRLGKAYSLGLLGVSKDMRSAEHYFTLATKSGSSLAWYGLAEIALRQKEEKKAAKFLSIAVQKGSSVAAVRLAELQRKEKTLCHQALRNYGMAFEWSDLVIGMLTQAFQHYSMGNATYALKLYEHLAWAGVEEAQANAAYIYDQAMNNQEMAKTYYELSAEQGNAHAHKMLGDYYYSNNLNLSHTAFRRAAEMNHYEAMFNLAYMYQHGEGVPAPDPFLAKRYYDLAAGSPSAVYAVTLSLMYLYLSSSNSLFGSIDFAAYWNDTVVITFLCILLSSLMLFRARW